MLIENTGVASLHLPTGRRLDGGVNDVDPKEWEKACTHKVVMAWLSAGMLKTPSGSSGKPLAVVPDAPTVESLSNYSAHDAEALIEKTFSRDLLGTWLAAEKRGKIKRALESQLEAVKVTEG